MKNLLAILFLSAASALASSPTFDNVTVTSTLTVAGIPFVPASGTNSIPAFNSSGGSISITGTSKIPYFDSGGNPTTIGISGASGNVALTTGAALNTPTISGGVIATGTLAGLSVNTGTISGGTVDAAALKQSGTGLGSLAFQSGLFSGTSSGLNTGDQTATSIGAIATLNGTGTSTTIVSGTFSGTSKITPGAIMDFSSGTSGFFQLWPSSSIFQGVEFGTSGGSYFGWLGGSSKEVKLVSEQYVAIVSGGALTGVGQVQFGFNSADAEKIFISQEGAADAVNTSIGSHPFQMNWANWSGSNSVNGITAIKAQPDSSGNGQINFYLNSNNGNGVFNAARNGGSGGYDLANGTLDASLGKAGLILTGTAKVIANSFSATSTASVTVPHFNSGTNSGVNVYSGSMTSVIGGTVVQAYTGSASLGFNTATVPFYGFITSPTTGFGATPAGDFYLNRIGTNYITTDSGGVIMSQLSTFRGRTLFAIGSDAFNSQSREGDTTTGISWLGSGSMSIASSGTRQMTVSPSGVALGVAGSPMFLVPSGTGACTFVGTGTALTTTTGARAIIKVTGTLVGGTATVGNASLTSSPINAWAQDNASGALTNVGVLTVTVSGTVATITSTVAIDTSPFTLFISP